MTCNSAIIFKAETDEVQEGRAPMILQTPERTAIPQRAWPTCAALASGIYSSQNTEGVQQSLQQGV